MAELAISIAEKLIEVIATEAITEICRLWGYKDELEQLSKTINTIKNVLLDADSKRDNLSNTQRGYIAELKDAVYDADDLFDEFRTLVELGQISGDKGGKFLGKVRRLFSSKKNKLSRARKMSRRVEEIKGHLDAIASNYSKFGFKVEYQPIIRRPEETCSYVDAKGIIGRDEDKDAIIDSLLAPDCDDEVRFLTVVGVGGLGKTALAQLVYNDEKIKQEFKKSRVWVCVSDQEGVQFDVKTILSKMIEVSTEGKPDDSSSMESVKNQFQKRFEGEKLFLVLDDVWNEDHGDWGKLREFLMMFGKGSKILVTSRSEITGNIIGSKHVYRLGCLSEEESQKLFDMSAFEEGEKSYEMVKIGENIVEKCYGIPLAIKVVGSLLYGQGISMWQSIERSDLADIGNDKSDRILHILKLSYYNLAPSLKRCFSYCAVYPKDFEIGKTRLIYHWMAHGYVVPLVRGQSIDDAAEEYFLILMRRCFFQDVEKDEYGNIRYVKIHDLMHDVAKDVGKGEICVVTSKGSKLEEKIRHVNFGEGENYEGTSLCRSKLRSYICNSGKNFVLDDQVLDLVTLRVLDLSYLDIESLPETIDRLLLLRYLNLTGNGKLELLPKSITKLYNLQTLILRDCWPLNEVPKDICNLTNLRHLDLRGCRRLMDDDKEELPGSILKLRNLRELPCIKASNYISDEELKMLQQLFYRVEGNLLINGEYRSDDLVSISGVYLDWVLSRGVLEKLELPPYISELKFVFCHGKIVPWSAVSLTHYLLLVEINECRELEQIPVLSTLPNLRSLVLSRLDSLEYMENGISNSSNDTIAAAEVFPSLESLVIVELPKFKAWWKGDFTTRIIFPRLHILSILGCPNLALNLHCPSILEELKLTKNSERLVVTGELEKLRQMEIDHHDHLKVLPPTNNCLTFLKLTEDIDVESAMEAVQKSCASSLRTLILSFCKKLKRLPRFDHLIALEKLTFFRNYDLSICEDDEVTFPQKLRELVFYYLPKMKSLPKGMQHLISLQALILSGLENMEGGLPEWMSYLSCLQSLYIENCPGIKTLPQAIKDLTSLDMLAIICCPLLEERCQNPDGQDFDKIQHIRSLHMSEVLSPVSNSQVVSK